MRDGERDSRSLIQETDEIIGDAILLLEGFLSDRNFAQVTHLAEVIASMIDLRKRLITDLRRQRLKQRR